ncbi:BMP family ABC transporter substrate-binding protein [Blastococcus sp. SYSU D00820]
MSLPIGATIAGCRVVRLLGRGGMGSVYLVQNLALDRPEVLKVMHGSLATDPQLRARFEHEARLAARLHHPNVVTVHGLGVTGEDLWIRMQYVEGTDLAQVLSTGPLDLGRALHVLSSVAAALDTAHGAGLLHRDVKPANVLIAPDPTPGGPGARVLLTDFGIAKALDTDLRLTVSGQAFLTPAYAAPEVFGGGPVDRRVDVYALGCVLFEMLTGRVPYPRESFYALLTAHATEPVPDPRQLRPDLPPGITAVLAAALAKDPAQRFPSCGALAAAATAALTSSGGTPAPPPPVAAPAGADSPTDPLPGPHRVTVTGLLDGGRRLMPLGRLDTAVLPGAERAAAEELVRAAWSAGDGVQHPTAGPGALLEIAVEHAGGTERMRFAPAAPGRPEPVDRLAERVAGPHWDAALRAAGGFGAPPTVVGDRGSPEQGSAPVPPPAPPVRGRRTGVLVAAGVAVLLVVATVLTVVLWPRDEGPAGATASGSTSSASPGTAPVETVRIGVAYDLAEPDEADFNNLTYLGLSEAVGEDVALKMQAVTPVAADGSDRADLLTELADQGYDPVIAVGFTYVDALAQVAPRYPDTRFAVVDASVEGLGPDNVTGLLFAEEQAAFLAGAAAALTSSSGTVGFVGGVPSPVVQRFEAGYRAGAQAAAPGTTVTVRYLSPPGDFTGFADPAAGQAVAAGMYAAGTDVVFTVAAASNPGVFLAAAESGGWAIGADTDEYRTVGDPSLQPAILTSAVKNVDVAVRDYVTAVLAGEDVGGDVVHDLAAGGVGLAASGNRIGDIRPQLDALADRVVSGEITVPTRP